VEKNSFRQDLYYRLKVVVIELPPLIERLEDIPLLVKHFCELYNKRFQKEIRGVTDDVTEAFMRYAWPGNVRELEHVIERAFVFCQDKAIDIDHIPPEILAFHIPRRISATAANAESERIVRMLEKTDWNRTKSARLLGISRKTLYKKIRKYKLTRKERGN